MNLTLSTNSGGTFLLSKVRPAKEFPSHKSADNKDKLKTRKRYTLADVKLANIHTVVVLCLVNFATPGIMLFSLRHAILALSNE
jgi:hypothetical protein